MNLKNNYAYHTVLLSPIAFEDKFYFLINLPGMALASYLIEWSFGSRILIMSYLFNAGISAATTVWWHWHIGFFEVWKRGRVSNHNGNVTLFLTTFLACMAPGFMIYNGKKFYSKIPFFIIPFIYFLFYFQSSFIS